MVKNIFLLLILGLGLILSGCSGTYNFEENNMDSGTGYNVEVETDKSSVSGNVKIEEKNDSSISFNTQIEKISENYSKYYKVNNKLTKKEQAKEFSLKVVQTYFEKNYENYILSLNKPLYSFWDDRTIKKEFEEYNNYNKKLNNEYGLNIEDNPTNISFETSMEKGFDDLVEGNKTYKEYLKYYKTEILTVTEFKNSYPNKLTDLHNFKYTEKDYFFIGWEKINNSINSFIFDDYYFFVVREIESKWKIVAIR